MNLSDSDRMADLCDRAAFVCLGFALACLAMGLPYWIARGMG